MDVKMLQKAILFHLFTWATRHKEAYPKYVFGFLFAVAAMTVSGLALAALHPAAGEIYQGFFIRFGFLIMLAGAGILLTLVVTAFVAVATSVSRMEIKALPAPQSPLALLSGISIAPDVLLIMHPNDDPEQFAELVKQEAKLANNGRWVVVLQFRFPLVTIFGAETYTYDRDEPIFARPDVPELSGRIAPAGTLFVEETEAQFVTYVKAFVREFRDWSPRKKAALSAGRTGSPALEILKHSANILLFLLFSVAAFGQSKTQQVADAVGVHIREIPATGSDISYTFETPGGGLKTYNRIGDGQSSYTQLLQKVPGVGTFNDEGGRLVEIQRDGVLVARGAHVEYVNQSPADDMRPRRAETPVMDKPAFETPDSAAMIEMAERAQYEIWKASQTAGAVAKPWWEVVMSVFWVLYPLLLIFSLIAWVFARVFASEGMMMEHKYARRALVIVLLSVAAVVLCNLMLWAISTGAGPIPLTLFACVLAVVAYFIVSRLTPNFTPARGNEPERGMITDFQRRLNG
jgi:hypothetical protein